MPWKDTAYLPSGFNSCRRNRLRMLNRGKRSLTDIEQTPFPPNSRDNESLPMRVISVGLQ